MSLWLIRAGKHGEDENTALEKGLAIIGWIEMPDLSGIRTYEELKNKYAEMNPDYSPNQINNQTAQLWAFFNRIKKDDLVVLPLKTRSLIAIGQITGDYRYFEGRHTRKVKWIKKDIPRSEFGQDLLYSFGAFMTVCRIKRNDAEERVKQIIKGNPDPYLKVKDVKKSKESSPEEIIEEESNFIDLEEHAFDQIRKQIESKFKGHDLTRLIEAILSVNGYQTFRSPEGPDGGVDILAGYGPMGFDRPRICVQVKLGGVQNDPSIRELEGVMSRIGAEQGLFVSWNGFKKSALEKLRDIFFKVRLWDDKKLISSLLECYEKLPDEIQAELPMKRIWVVVPEDE